MALIPMISAAGNLITKATKLVSPVNITLQAAETLNRKASNQSIELFTYDFVALITKLVIYFVAAFVIAKFMEAVILTRGVFTTIIGLLGVQIPEKDQVPQQIQELFGDGFHGVKYWDVIKVIAILLVGVEYLRYVEVNSVNGGKTSPMTTGIFLLLELFLVVTTIPELIQAVKKFKSIDLNKEAFR